MRSLGQSPPYPEEVLQKNTGVRKIFSTSIPYLRDEHSRVKGRLAPRNLEEVRNSREKAKLQYGRKKNENKKKQKHFAGSLLSAGRSNPLWREVPTAGDGPRWQGPNRRRISTEDEKNRNQGRPRPNCKTKPTCFIE